MCQQNWLENLRIISAPGFNKYKQNVFLSYLSYIMLSMYKANKGVVVVVVLNFFKKN